MKVNLICSSAILACIMIVYDSLFFPQHATGCTYVFNDTVFECNEEWEFLRGFDDGSNIVENTLLNMSLLNPSTYVEAWNLALINVWEPPSVILKIMVYQYFGMDSRAFRLVALAFHLATAGILYFVIKETLELLRRDQFDRKRCAVTDNLCIWFGVAFFVFLPLSMEVVAWPSAQPYPFSSFFQVSAILCLLNFYKGKHRAAYYVLHYVFFMLSVFSKSAMMLTVPAAQLVLGILHEIEISSFDVHESIHFLFHVLLQSLKMLIPYCACIAIAVVKNWQAQVVLSQNHGILHLIYYKLDIISGAVSFLLGLVAVPVGLRPYYQTPAPDVSDMLSRLGVLIIFTTALICASNLTNKYFPFLLWLWILVSFAPVSRLVDHGELESITCDRYAYTFAVPLSIAATYFVECVYEWIQNATVKVESGKSRKRTHSQEVHQQGNAPITLKPLKKILLAVSCVFLIGHRALVSQKLLAHWKNPQTLWMMQLEYEPHYFAGLKRYLYYLMELVQKYPTGELNTRYEAEYAHYSQMLASHRLTASRDGTTYRTQMHQLTAQLVSKTPLDEICKALDDITLRHPDIMKSDMEVVVLNNLGVCRHLLHGDKEAALRYFEQALETQPDHFYTQHLLKNIENYNGAQVMWLE